MWFNIMWLPIGAIFLGLLMLAYSQKLNRDGSRYLDQLVRESEMATDEFGEKFD